MAEPLSSTAAKRTAPGTRRQPCCKLRPKGERCLCAVLQHICPSAHSPKWTPFHVPRPDRWCPESAVLPAKRAKAMRGFGDNLETPGCSQGLNDCCCQSTSSGPAGGELAEDRVIFQLERVTPNGRKHPMALLALHRHQRSGSVCPNPWPSSSK